MADTIRGTAGPCVLPNMKLQEYMRLMKLDSQCAMGALDERQQRLTTRKLDRSKLYRDLRLGFMSWRRTLMRLVSEVT